MMRQMTTACLAAALATLSLATTTDGGPATSAPSLDAGPYTVHVAGRLEGVIELVAKTTGWRIELGWARAADNEREPISLDARVSLKIDDGTLQDILLELCRQLGTIYQTQGDGRSIVLRRGDMELDSRPGAELGDYVVRAISATIAPRSTCEFFPGEAEPRVEEEVGPLKLSLEVAARSLEAYRQLAGLDGEWKAVTDTGHVMQPAGPEAPRFRQVNVNQFRMSAGFGHAVELPLPPPGTARLARLEGSLGVYSEVKVTEIQIKPLVKGQSFEGGDISGTVESVQERDGVLSIEAELFDKTTRYSRTAKAHVEAILDGSW